MIVIILGTLVLITKYTLIGYFLFKVLTGIASWSEDLFVRTMHRHNKKVKKSKISEAGVRSFFKEARTIVVLGLAIFMFPPTMYILTTTGIASLLDPTTYSTLKKLIEAIGGLI